MEDPNAISHGICHECLTRLLHEKGIPLARFLDSLEGPVLVVMPDGVIASANDKARHLLKKEISEVEGFLAGMVFECIHARSPGGCGTTTHCSGCAIRIAITKTLATGRSQYGIPVTLIQVSQEGDHRQRMEFSTQKVENVVLLRIDSIATPRQ